MVKRPQQILMLPVMKELHSSKLDCSYNSRRDFHAVLPDKCWWHNYHLPRYFRRTFISHLSERLQLSRIESIYCILFLLLGYVTTSYFNIFNYGSIVITKFLQQAPLFKRSSSNIPLHKLVWLLLADHMTIKNLLIPVLDGLQPLNLKFEFRVWR